MNRWFKPASSLIFLAVLLLLLVVFVLPGAAGAQSIDLIITGVVDGPLTGGIPKAVEFYVLNDISDLSIYGFESANNGGGATGEEYTFPAAAAVAGDFIYVASESAAFVTFFGFSPDDTSGAANINGDDAIVLYQNGTIVDVFGEVDTDGSGEPWEYLDGWAYRNDGTGPDGDAFALLNWKFSGPNALDDETSNATAATPFPIGTYSPVAPDVPPTVSTTRPSNGADYVAIDATIVINFSEAVTTAGDWFEIECDSSPVDVVAGGGPTSVTLDPVSDLPSSAECTVTVLASQVQDQDEPYDNMEEDYSFSFTTASICGDPATFIHEVQGPGFSSPLEGQIVTVEAVVVGDFQQYDELRGFFIQEEKADFDNQKETSEGIFVYSPLAGVSVGDRVRVTGKVDEYFDFTEITDVELILTCGAAGSKEYGTVNLRLPEKFDGQLEQYEGMYVKVPSRMTVAQNYFLGRYGQLTLTSQNRLYQPTNQALPGSTQAETLADRNARSLLFLDDGIGSSNPNPVPYLGSPPPAVLRGGDTVKNLVGVLDYGLINSSYDSDYRLHPTEEPNFKQKNERTETPDKVGGELQVASFNVLNFFNGNGQGGGFPTERGAFDFNQFVRQRIKIYEALKAIDADIVGVMEIENDGFDQYSAIAELVKVLNEGPCWNSPDECLALDYSSDGMGENTYAFVDAGVPALGDDEIAVGLIYKLSAVSPEGAAKIVDEDPFTDPNNLGEQKNRPALVQTFAAVDGEKFTVVVNHLKSKGSSCGYGDDDTTTGQGNCNLTRTLAADYLVNTLLPTDPTGSSDPDFLIIGDLNAYAKEDPVTTITSAGYKDLVAKYEGKKAYTYTFDGLLGTLDHALASNSMEKQVKQATVWHINADEPAVIDYNDHFNPPGYYSPDQFRASDHDPVIVGLQLKSTGKGRGRGRVR